MNFVQCTRILVAAMGPTVQGTRSGGTTESAPKHTRKNVIRSVNDVSSYRQESTMIPGFRSNFSAVSAGSNPPEAQTASVPILCLQPPSIRTTALATRYSVYLVFPDNCSHSFLVVPSILTFVVNVNPRCQRCANNVPIVPCPIRAR